jgi:hypothetical protein
VRAGCSTDEGESSLRCAEIDSYSLQSLRARSRVRLFTSLTLASCLPRR